MLTPRFYLRKLFIIWGEGHGLIALLSVHMIFGFGRRGEKRQPMLEIEIGHGVSSPPSPISFFSLFFFTFSEMILT